MAYIKKLKDNELIGGTDNTDVYPVTSTEAVYNKENVSQEYINNHVDGSKIVNGTITNNKIADSTISIGKLDNDVQTKIQQGTQRAWNPKGTFELGEVYNYNDLVYSEEDNSSYISLQANNEGHVPGAEGEEAWWMKVVDGSYVNLLEEELQQLVDSISEGTQQQVEELNEALEALEAQADQSRQDIQDIVDSLAVVQTTGQSASDVMSQKAVTDMITETADLGISYPVGLNSSNPDEWISFSAGYSSKFLKIKSGDKITIKAADGKCSYSLFASYDHTVGQKAKFATGYGYESINQGESVSITVGEDGVMLWVRSDTAQQSQTREPIVIISRLDDSEKKISSLEDITTDGFNNEDINTLVFSNVYNKPEQFNLFLHPSTFRRYIMYPLDGFPEDGELVATLGSYDESIVSIGVFVVNAEAYDNSGERLGGSWLYAGGSVIHEDISLHFSELTNPSTAKYIQIVVIKDSTFPTEEEFDRGISYCFRGSVSISGEGLFPRVETLENKMGILSTDDISVKEYNIDLLPYMETANGAVLLANASPWKDIWRVGQTYYGAWIDVSAYRGKRYKYVQSGLNGRLAFTTQKYTTNNAVITYAHRSFLYQVPAREAVYGIVPDDAEYAFVYYRHDGQDRTPAFFGIETYCTLSGKISEYDEKAEELDSLKNKVDDIAANSSQKELYIGSVINATTDAGGATSISSTTQVCMTDVLQLPFRGMKITPVIPAGINCNLYVGTVGNAVTGSTIPLLNNTETVIPSQYEYYHIEFIRSSGLTASEVETYIANGQLQIVYEGKNTTDVFTRNVESMKKLRAASHIIPINSDTEIQHHQLPILIHTTDQHGNRAALENIYKFAEAVGADAILNTGDTCSQNPQNGYGYAKELADNSSVPTIVCVGNHDGYNVTSQADIRAKFIEPFRTESYVMGGDGKTYFYYDLPNASLRVISLNSSEAGYSQWNDSGAVTQDQIDFFYGSLLSAPEKYGVVLIIHMPGFYGSTQQSSYSLDPISENWNDNMLSQWPKQLPFLKPLQDIVDAFIGRTTFSISYTNTATGMNEASGTSVSKTGDFSSVASDVEFIAWSTGHHHKDKIGYYQNTTHRQLHMNCTCTASSNRQNVTSPLPRDYEEALDAFNVYVIDRANHKVKIVRIGVDLTIDMKRRDYLEASYVDE